uniref:Transcriptional regulator n=1 Tax=Parastrongyloides trichosuri TaxID=131310 RepID=A0A0N4ZD65_PARTI
MLQRAVGPAGRHRLGLGPELHAFHAVLVGVAEARTLPAAEGVVGHRHRDRHIDADHADVDAGGEVAGRAAVLGEDGDAVAVLVLARQAQGLLKVGGADDLQHRAEDFFLIRRHVRRHMVEQRRADEVALLMPLQAEVAPVYDQFGAFFHALVDPAQNLVLVGLSDDGTVVGLGVGRDADAQVRDFRDQTLAQFIGGALADRHHDRQGHAALAGRAVGRAGQILDDLIHVRVRQDDAVVLGAAHGLNALAVGRALLEHIVGDVRRADEADGVDQRMLKDGVDRDLVAVDDVQHALGRARLHHQLARTSRRS